MERSETFKGTITKSVQLKYLWFEPNGIRTGERRPLVLFLHGAGERGDDLSLLHRHGVPRMTADESDWPFFACSPQCPADSTWLVEDDAVMALLDSLLARHPIDPDRVYLTGLSMGGGGTWHLGAAYPDRFAALAPICGESSPYRLQPIARMGVPVWVFHGIDDGVIPVHHTERAVQALRDAGAEPRVTLYPDTDHDSWTRTYEDPEFWTWLLAQRRNNKRADPNR